MSKEETKPNCSKHKKDILGVTDMKDLAEMIGDLHYETLSEFLDKLSDKLYLDGAKDSAANRIKLGDMLHYAGLTGFTMLIFT